MAGKKLTACVYDCPDTCSLLAVFQDRELKIKGNPDHPFTRGVACRKGRGLPGRMRAEDRVTRPLLKKDGGFEPISWDRALDLCAERIQALRHDPARMLHAHGHGYRGVLATASTFLFHRLGASTLGGCLCDDAGIAACVADFGLLDQNDPLDLMNSATVVNWGRDVARSSQHLAMVLRDARKNGTTLITVSPGGDGAEKWSDHVVRIAPATDRYLCTAIAKRLRDNKLIDKLSIKKSSNWHDYDKILKTVDIPDSLNRCGIGTDDFELLYRAYAENTPTASILSWGMTRYEHGGESARHVNALAMASGQIGVAGGGAYYNISSGRNFNLSWTTPPGPERREILLPDFGNSLTRADPPVEFAWVDGHNVVNQVPDALTAARAFEAIPFTVTMDAFLNDTALRSDLVLPCALPLERDDVLGSALHNWVAYSAKVADPPGQARADFDIAAQLGERLAPAITLPTRDQYLARALDSPYLSLSPEELRQKGFERAERPMVAFQGLEFGHPDGLYHFVETLTPSATPGRDYPFYLLSLVSGDHIHSQIPESEQRGLPTVWVNPEARSTAHIPRGTTATLATPHGEMKVVLDHDPTLARNAIIYRRDDWLKCGRGVNQVIAPMETDMGRNAAYYQQFARIDA